MQPEDGAVVQQESQVPIGALAQPAPLATVVGFLPGNDFADGAPKVVLRCESVNGTALYFLSVDHARLLSTQLLANAQEAARLGAGDGLVVPGLIVP